MKESELILKHKALGQTLLTACKILDREKVLDELGHFSVRLPGEGGLVMMNGRISPGQAEEDDLIVLDLEGNQIAGKLDAAKEIPLHLRIYRHRPEIQAVVHTHSPAVLTLSVSGFTLRALENLGAVVFGAQAPVFEEYGLVDNDAMGDRIVDSMGAASTIVLKGHGDILAASSIEECCVYALWAEKAAQLQINALALGEPHWMPEQEIASVREQVIAGKAFNRTWNYYAWKWHLQ